MKRPDLFGVASRLVRGAMVTIVALVAVCLTVAIIAWDTDLYKLRDKFEHARIALFGEWSPTFWCPSGRDTATCGAVDDFESALQSATDFTFFYKETVADTGHDILTGVRFSTARDVVAGRPEAKWCYVVLSQGAVSHQIDLAKQSADNPPSFADFSSLDERALDGSGLSRNMLDSVARSHCRFDR